MAVLLALLLMLASTNSRASEVTLVGTWYGHDYQPNGKLIQRVTHQRADGTFSIEFRRHKNCRLVWRQSESGIWWREGPIETKLTQKINGLPAHYVDEYEILKLKETFKRTRHLQSGTVFTYERVSDDFEIPNCEATS